MTAYPAKGPPTMATNLIHLALVDAAAELIDYDRADDLAQLPPHELMRNQYLRGIVEMIMQIEGRTDRDHIIAQILAKAADNLQLGENRWVEG